MTNTVSSHSGPTGVQELETLLERVGCSLVVLGYDLEPNESLSKLARVCENTIEGGFLDQPTEQDIDVLFSSLANYKFTKSRPLIMETFN